VRSLFTQSSRIAKPHESIQTFRFSIAFCMCPSPWVCSVAKLYRSGGLDLECASFGSGLAFHRPQRLFRWSPAQLVRWLQLQSLLPEAEFREKSLVHRNGKGCVTITCSVLAMAVMGLYMLEFTRMLNPSTHPD
jgi:hypothetical protein